MNMNSLRILNYCVGRIPGGGYGGLHLNPGRSNCSSHSWTNFVYSLVYCSCQYVNEILLNLSQQMPTLAYRLYSGGHKTVDKESYFILITEKNVLTVGCLSKCWVQMLCVNSIDLFHVHCIFKIKTWVYLRPLLGLSWVYLRSILGLS